MPWAQTLSDLSPYLSLHTSACALVSACCSFLPSFSQHVSHGTRDSPTCPSLPLTHTPCMHAYRQDMHVQTEGENIQLRSLLCCFPLTLLLSVIIQSVHSHAQRSLHLGH